MDGDRTHDHDDVGDRDVDEVLAEFGGDPRAAIRALLHDLNVLARDFGEQVSRGFVRADRPRPRKADKR